MSMRRLGTIKIFTNKRITIPEDLLKVLKVEEGDFLDFYESDDGTVIVRMEKGVPVEKKRSK